MSDLKAELIGLSRLNTRLDVITPTLQDKLRVFFAAFTLRLADKVRANILTRFNSKGPLYQAVQSELIEEPGSITGRVFVDGVPYAAIQEYGGKTGPHVILPVNASALAFMVGPAGFSGGGASGLVFAKKINHPGSRIPERSYARWALVQMRGEFDGGIRGVVEEATGAGLRIAAE